MRKFSCTKVICDNKADIFDRLRRKKISLKSKSKSKILVFVDSLLAFFQKSSIVKSGCAKVSGVPKTDVHGLHKKKY